MIKLPLYERAIYAVPLIGWMLKDVVYGDKDNIWYFLFTVAFVWGMAIWTFGYPAIILPMLCAAFAMFGALIHITRG